MKVATRPFQKQLYGATTFPLVMPLNVITMLFLAAIIISLLGRQWRCSGVYGSASPRRKPNIGGLADLEGLTGAVGVHVFHGFYGFSSLGLVLYLANQPQQVFALACQALVMTDSAQPPLVW